MIRAAIFDLDGTLADTIPALHAGMNGALRAFGFPDATRERIIASINFGSREFVRRAFPDDFPPERIDEALAVYKAEYAKVYGQTASPFPWIPAVLDELKKRGVKLGCCTNKMDDLTQKLIVALFGEGLFDAVTGQGPFEPKPAPASTLDQLYRFGVEPCACAFVGDSHIDMRTARNAGCIPVAVTWGYRPESVLREEGARFVCHSGDELLSTLLSL